MFERIKILFLGILKFPLVLLISFIIFLSAGPVGSMQLIIDYISSLKDEFCCPPCSNNVDIIS